MEKPIRYPWPGNVRELKNVVEHAMTLNIGKMLDLSPPQAAFSRADENLTHADAETGTHPADSEKKRMAHIRAGRRGGDAGMKRSALQSKMKKPGMRRPQE